MKLYFGYVKILHYDCWMVKFVSFTQNEKTFRFSLIENTNQVSAHFEIVSISLLRQLAAVIGLSMIM